MATFGKRRRGAAEPAGGLSRRQFIAGVSAGFPAGVSFAVAGVPGASFAAAGALPSPAPALADKAAPLPPLNFPRPLRAQIVALGLEAQKEKKEPFILTKKYNILNDAERRMTLVLKLTPAQKVSGLTNPDLFRIQYRSPSFDVATPAYFKQPYRDFSEQKPDHIDQKFYDYKSTPVGAGSRTFWMDFAHIYLGGQLFEKGYPPEDGFSFEEIMCSETPDMANAAAIMKPRIHTRNGNGKAPNPALLMGSPAPVVMLDANRVYNFDAPKIFEEKFRKKNLGDVLKYSIGAGRATVQKYNVLAACAPDLTLTRTFAGGAGYIPYQGDDTAFGMNALQDLFNTFVAAFELARQQSPGGIIVINTGRIGVGADANNAKVVYVMQRFAARQVSNRIKLRFWNYKDAPADYAKIKQAFDRLPPAAKTVQALLDAAWTHWGRHKEDVFFV